MKVKLPFFLFCLIFIACKSNKPLAQSLTNISNDTLIHYINQSKKDTGFINPQVEKLSKENDLTIALGTLNYAWTRTGNYHVLVCKNKVWKLYSYQTKLYSDNYLTGRVTSTNIADSSAEKIKQLYTSSGLWKTNGDENGRLCTDKKDCNITDAENWALSISTPENIHTTTYYAPEFFEQCCPGNPYRHWFVAIAKEIIELSKNETAQ